MINSSAELINGHRDYVGVASPNSGENYGLSFPPQTPGDCEGNTAKNAERCQDE